MLPQNQKPEKVNYGKGAVVYDHKNWMRPRDAVGKLIAGKRKKKRCFVKTAMSGYVDQDMQEPAPHRPVESRKAFHFAEKKNQKNQEPKKDNTVSIVVRLACITNHPDIFADKIEKFGSSKPGVKKYRRKRKQVRQKTEKNRDKPVQPLQPIFFIKNHIGPESMSKNIHNNKYKVKSKNFKVKAAQHLKVRAANKRMRVTFNNTSQQD